MKTIILAVTILLFAASQGHAQNINWRALDGEPQNIIQLNVGYDFGFTTQIGVYRRMLFYRPILFGVDCSLQMGSTLVDDFKVRIGGQVQLVDWEGFSFAAKVVSNFRRFQNDFVRSVGFGADFAGVAGYYAETWHAAGEFGFDKAVTTNLIHSDVMKSYYPAIRDGWYVPTGGHYYYGVQAGKTLTDRLDLGLRIGETRAQFDDYNAAIPYYLQLGLGMKL